MFIEETLSQLVASEVVEILNTQVPILLDVKGAIIVENTIITNQAADMIIELDAIIVTNMDIRVVCVRKTGEKLAMKTEPKDRMERNLRKRNFSLFDT